MSKNISENSGTDNEPELRYRTVEEIVAAVNRADTFPPSWHDEAPTPWETREMISALAIAHEQLAKCAADTSYADLRQELEFLKAEHALQLEFANAKLTGLRRVANAHLLSCRCDSSERRALLDILDALVLRAQAGTAGGEDAANTTAKPSPKENL